MMCVLELFNYAEKLSFEDILKSTLIETQYLKQTLHSLVHAKILLNDKEMYEVNEMFSSKLVKFKINTLMIHYICVFSRVATH
jgi:hypothetical protein